MSTFNEVLASLKRLLRGGDDTGVRRGPVPPVTYPRLSVVETPPKNSEIAAGSVTIVRPANRLKWAMLLCPCGCKAVITLSLQSAKCPSWGFKKSKAGRATLSPSIWRDVGCFSHFFLEDGRIYWCGKGVSPEEARAEMNQAQETK